MGLSGPFSIFPCRTCNTANKEPHLSSYCPKFAMEKTAHDHKARHDAPYTILYTVTVGQIERSRTAIFLTGPAASYSLFRGKSLAEFKMKTSSELT